MSSIDEPPITRQDLAVIIVAYTTKVAGHTLSPSLAAANFADASDIAAYAKASIDAMQRSGLISGKPGNAFDPKGKATRAEVAKILELLLKDMMK